MNALVCPYCGMCKAWEAHGITVSGDTRNVHYQGQSVRLSKTRGILFKTLFDAIGHTVSKEKLYDALRRNRSKKGQVAQDIGMSIRRMRKPLTPLGLEITTTFDFGYRLEIPTNDTDNRSAA